MRPCQQQSPPKGWFPLKVLLAHLAELGSKDAPGCIRSVREVAQRCCERSGTGSHRPLYKQKVSDTEIRARIAAALLGA